MARRTLGEGQDEDEGAAPSVRPYAVARGRTAPSAAEWPLESLVRALVAARTGMTREQRAICDLTRDQYLSVAELSAHVRLPVPVVRVVLDDLSREGAVRVHAPAALAGSARRTAATTGSAAGSAPVPAGSAPSGGATWSPTSSLRVLGSVLDGISTL